jgi:hypothetical protein
MVDGVRSRPQVGTTAPSTDVGQTQATPSTQGTDPTPQNPHEQSQYAGQTTSKAPQQTTSNTDSRDQAARKSESLWQTAVDVGGDVLGMVDQTRKYSDAGLDLHSGTSKILNAAADSKLLGSSSTVDKLAKAAGSVGDKLGVLQKAVSGANLVANTYKSIANAGKTVEAVKDAIVKKTSDATWNAVGAVAKETKSISFAGKGVKSVGATVAKAIDKKLGTAGTEAAVKTGEVVAEKLSTTALGKVGEVALQASKAAGRLAPGLSVAIAAGDTALAAKAWHDVAAHKNASAEDKHYYKAEAVCASITAFGSGLAAAGSTSLVGEPLAAVGTVISVGASLVGAFWPKPKDMQK